MNKLKKISRFWVIALQVTFTFVFVMSIFSSSKPMKQLSVVYNTEYRDTINQVEEEQIDTPTDVDIPKEEEPVEVKEETKKIEEPKEEIKVEETKPVVTVPTVNTGKYSNYEDVGFVVTTGHTTYDINDDDYNLLVAVVASEAEGSIDDALGVISVILNRCDPSSKWSSNYENGTNPIVQITAPRQFSVYANGAYLKYMPSGSLYKGTKYLMVEQAVNDAIHNGIRNNTYQGFNAWGNTSYSDNYVLVGGNRFR